MKIVIESKLFKFLNDSNLSIITSVLIKFSTNVNHDYFTFDYDFFTREFGISDRTVKRSIKKLREEYKFFSFEKRATIEKIGNRKHYKIDVNSDIFKIFKDDIKEVDTIPSLF